MKLRQLFRVSAVWCAVVIALTTVRAADPFAEGVRKADPLTPEQEQKTFHLPPGFEMQLVAAEPDLRKPMNLAFDASGRLWITESREYPFPAKPGEPGRDTIRIFSNFDATGRAQKITTFATNLNIPIGIYPFLSPASSGGPPPTWKCIAWSIPNIWLFEDIDGDGVADKKEILFGPFDHTRDTHGNQSSFRRGFDGWLYATHGFNNRSTVKGRDGHEIFLPSGNTYRMRLDGSRLEHWTHGQVNPFGLTFDPLGNLYSADCHSSPIYQLLRGAYYPSFGAPSDGLGFAPVTIQHSHGSTAIGGIVYISDPAWPAEFQDNIFVGNVMTSRVNRDQINFLGATSKGKEMPDFLRSDDPWFRPVDLQIGPDGALYLADFYNRIIGHYEVPLSHPGRDRDRGRLWRAVYRGNAGDKPVARALPDFTKMPLKELIAELGSPNQTRRMLVLNYLADVVGQDAVKPVAQMLAGTPEPLQKVQGLWLLQRLGGAPALTAALEDKDRTVRVHALRMLADSATLPDTGAVVARLNDPEAFVQREAATALGLHHAGVNGLLELRQRVPKEDTHLLHVVRMALRNVLEKSFPDSELTEQNSRVLADVVASVTNSIAGSFLIAHLQKYSEPRDTMTRYLKHAVRFAPEKDLDTLARFTRTKFATDLDAQTAYFKSIQDGAAQRGLALSGGVHDWGTELATKLLAPPATAPVTDPVWVNTPLDAAPTASPWKFEERPSADGPPAPLMSSFPLGEALTGTLRSSAFALPAKLSFHLAGHDGPPTKPAQKKNVVRLRDATTKVVLREAWPARSDTAQKISWSLAEFAGQRGFIEVTDGDAGAAYAWFAFGRFEPALPELSFGAGAPGTSRQAAGADLARTLQIASLEPQLTKLLNQSAAEPEARAAAARALVVLQPDAAIPTVARLVNDDALDVSLREKFAVSLSEANTPAAHEALTAALRAAPGRFQSKLALSLASTKGGAELLLAAAESGKAPARLFQERAVRDHLTASKPRDLAARVAKLTKDLPQANAQVQKLIDQRAKDFVGAKASATKGAEVFTKSCAVCHQLDGKGALVGPQLDGLGGRGAERIIEDILDPNRNVDTAFRTTTLVLADGDVTSGLFRREEGAMLVLAESTGKEISIPKKSVKERRESETSLMPENFGEVIPPNEFDDLLAYLLTKRATKK
ncbi:MAG: c-type cytochrome [Pedosphaera sp.]|nr:c-type cytochrome [Pedosphaera sp.]